MSKKSNQITLEKAIQLKQTMQDLLKNKRRIFVLENSWPVKSERNYDLKQVISDKEDLSEKFVQLKIEIQKANLTIPEGEKTNISTLVYKLSEIKSDILTFEEALKPDKYTEGVKVKEGQELTYSPKYREIEINDWISTLKKEYYYIETQLTKLNKSIIIDLPFDPTNLI